MKVHIRGQLSLTVSCYSPSGNAQTAECDSIALGSDTFMHPTTCVMKSSSYRVIGWTHHGLTDSHKNFRVSFSEKIKLVLPVASHTINWHPLDLIGLIWCSSLSLVITGTQSLNKPTVNIKNLANWWTSFIVLAWQLKGIGVRLGRKMLQDQIPAQTPSPYQVCPWARHSALDEIAC